MFESRMNTYINWTILRQEENFLQSLVSFILEA